MNVIRHHLYALFCIAVLAACAQIGVSAPATFNEKLVAGYSAVIEVRTTATTLLDAKKISSDDAANVSVTADVARAGLDVARNLSKTDLTAAEGRLNAVRTSLTALSAYLATRK